jgi:hypothetical protein
VSAPVRRAADVPLPGGNFRLFVTRLSFQAMMSLGILENPLTRQRTRNLANARMLLDDLRMLREKTDANLAADEEAHLVKVISDIELALERIEETETASDDGADDADADADDADDADDDGAQASADEG